MNVIKKLSIMLFAVVMCVMLGVTAWAAGDVNESDADFSASLTSNTICVSADERTVTVTVSAAQAVDIFSLDATVVVPNGWSVASVTSTTLTDVNYGENGRVIWYAAANALAKDLLVITYTVPAGVTGTFELGITDLELYKLSETATATGYDHITSGTKVTTTLTINPHSDMDTDQDHNCDACGTENITVHTHSTYDKDDSNHWSVCACGETITDTTASHDFTIGDCVCGAKEPVTDVSVIYKGDALSNAYSVEGSVVTITYSSACKVGYWDATNSKYIAISAVATGTGSYTFTAPEGVNEVLLVVKGDINGDGNVNSADTTLINRSFVLTTHAAYQALNSIQMFAANVNNDENVNSADTTLINRSFVLTTHAAYLKLTW